mmetsp:Transcript_40305/g.95775  ORF Transcript_40305/g.95775 Transcript_40305/m.95775 type:complete len:152 (+) Transcript_40305:30-485(+)
MQQGAITNEVWSFDFSNQNWTKIGPRADNFREGRDKAYIVSPYDAILFPQTLPVERFSFASVWHEHSHSFHIMGGAGGSLMTTPLKDVFRFSTDFREWAVPHTGFDNVPSLARHDAAAAHLDGRWACVFGGAKDMDFLGDMVCVFVGEDGM